LVDDVSQQDMSLQIEDSPVPVVAEEVRDFYDRYPYPRPVDNLDQYRRLWQDRQRRLADYHLMWPGKPFRDDQSILIAGCGTSQAAKHAMRWPGAQVTGVDISATSVSCTEELKQRYNLQNLDVYQIPIERIDDLEMSFDQIVCTGVLHHLADPDAGLSALRRVLNPGGALHLMVYAPYGRAGLYMLQEFCRRTGIHATDDGIRELIDALSWLPAGHPLENVLRQAPDFRHGSALADALLHPQDRAYSVPQLFAFIEKAGLTFGRWIRQAPYIPQCGVMANIPQSCRMSRLALAEQHAAAELFRGTMIRHSMIVYRSDDSAERPPVEFSGPEWLGYVPIRMSDTICIQERLPPGAAAVLINQTHTFKDLFMPIDPMEKRLFDAIDGNRSIREIAERSLPPSATGCLQDRARRFFERLWRYDQVVFDASRAAGTADAMQEMVRVA
jgi:SAM-dependent methyltransferase